MGLPGTTSGWSDHEYGVDSRYCRFEYVLLPRRARSTWVFGVANGYVIR